MTDQEKTIRTLEEKLELKQKEIERLTTIIDYYENLITKIAYNMCFNEGRIK